MKNTKFLILSLALTNILSASEPAGITALKDNVKKAIESEKSSSLIELYDWRGLEDSVKKSEATMWKLVFNLSFTKGNLGKTSLTWISKDKFREGEIVWPTNSRVLGKFVVSVANDEIHNQGYARYGLNAPILNMYVGKDVEGAWKLIVVKRYIDKRIAE